LDANCLVNGVAQIPEFCYTKNTLLCEDLKAKKFLCNLTTYFLAFSQNFNISPIREKVVINLYLWKYNRRETAALVGTLAVDVAFVGLKYLKEGYHEASSSSPAEI